MRLRSSVLSAFVLLLIPAQALAASGDPYRSLQWGLEKVNGPRAWTRATGAGVVVAVIDSGVDASHPDLDGRLVAGYDFVDDDVKPDDRNGHGTLIAGIIAANRGNGLGVVGIAPRAKIMPVRVLDEDGSGSSSDVAAGIRWAVEHGADVVNLSLAQDAARGVLANLLADPAVDDAIQEASDAGATVVIAAGNDPEGGRSETAYDATAPGALVVGATTRSDRRAAYANHGDGLDLVAPGGGSPKDPADEACSEDNGIVSAWWNPETRRSSYGAGCGTSMAVAFVSGVAALLHERGSTNVEAVQRIMATAEDIGAPGRDDATGVGRLDAARALGVPRSVPKRPTAQPQSAVAAAASVPKVKGAATSRPAPAPASAPVPAPKTSSTQVPAPIQPDVAFAPGSTYPSAPSSRAALVNIAALALVILAGLHAGRALGIRISRR